MLYQQKKLMSTRVSDQEAKDFYDMNQDKFKPIPKPSCWEELTKIINKIKKE